MTIVCGIDVETTGFDPETGEITELAYVIKEWRDQKPLHMASFICKVMGEIPEEVVNLTGITRKHCAAGFSIGVALDTLYSDCAEYGVEFFMAHNATFDKAFLHKECLKGIHAHPYPWLCTMEDIDWGPRSRTLTYLAADHGFLNPFPHAALFDVMTMLRVAEQYSLDDMIARSRSPSIIVRAVVTYDERDFAKDRRYRWESIDGLHFPKQWVKKIKQCDLAREREQAPFTVEIVHGG